MNATHPMRLPERRDPWALAWLVLLLAVAIGGGVWMSVRAWDRHEVVAAPVVTGTVVAHAPAAGLVSENEFTIRLASPPALVHARLPSEKQLPEGTRVRFHYTGDPRRPVYLFEIEENPFGIMLLTWAWAVVLGALMFRQWLRARGQGGEAFASSDARADALHGLGERTLRPSWIPVVLLGTGFAIMEGLLLRDGLRPGAGPLLWVMIAGIAASFAVFTWQWHMRRIEVTRDGITVTHRPWARRRIGFDEIAMTQAKSLFNADRPRSLVFVGRASGKAIATVNVVSFARADVVWLCHLPPLRTVVYTPFPRASRPGWNP